MLHVQPAPWIAEAKGNPEAATKLNGNGKHKAESFHLTVSRSAAGLIRLLLLA